jgi:N-acetylglucosaminyldiphosphoundecaprenol N-acetyl-beta-D-mannosaminyltransferase
LSDSASIRRVADRTRAASPSTDQPDSRAILGVRIDATSYDDAVGRVLAWASRRESRAVAIATVNNVMEAQDDPGFANVMRACDLVTPDGMPLVWGLRALGVRDATRVYGPNLMPKVLAAAAEAGVPVGFYGGTEDVLRRMLDRIAVQLPSLQVPFAFSPPFRTPTDAEDADTVQRLAASGCRVLFVGIGCPKQERWMVEHRPNLEVVMLGVGAAFDFYAGSKRQAPVWMQSAGLEWVFRLATEPRRQWKRYLRHNPRFVAMFGRQLGSAYLRRGREVRRIERGDR